MPEFPNSFDRAVSGELAGSTQHNQVVDAAEYMKGRALPFWPAEAFRPGRSTGNDVSVQETDKVPGSAYEIEFPNEDTRQDSYGYFICPQDYTGDDSLKALIYWAGDDDSESVRWQIGIRGWNHGEDMTGSHTNSDAGTFSSGDDISNLRISELEIISPALSAKDLVCCEIVRFPTHTGDTLSASAFVFGIALEAG